jgi:hypothetical protein
MLRIHFSGADLARTQIAQEPDPMWETVLSLHILLSRAGRLVFQPWRQRARSAVPRQARTVLAALAPPVGNFPDSLTPAAAQRGLDHGIEALLSTPRRRLRKDVESLLRSLPAEVSGLGHGDTGVLRTVATAVRAYHDSVLAPFWPAMRAAVRFERARLVRSGGPGDVEAMLNALPAPLRWEAPTLVTDYPALRTDEIDLHLDGRGLVLIPSYFCWREPVTLIDSDLPPVLVYPVERRDVEVDQLPDGGLAALAALLGPTRASVLEALDDGCTTSELARRLRISPASASTHTKVLREAGLVTSTRDANAMIHGLAPLGSALLARTF